MEFKQRSRWESPIFLRMLSEADTLEAEIAAVAYGDKVEAFRDSGMVSITSLEYEGPDLSPGGDRPNCMGGVRGKVHQQMYDGEGKKIDGRKAVVLYPSDEL